MGGGRTWRFDCMYQLYLTVSCYLLIILLNIFLLYSALDYHYHCKFNTVLSDSSLPDIR